MEKISNGILEIAVLNKGAELCSIKRIADNEELLWNANPKIWNRQAPVLFPIVGKVWNGEFQVNGKKYQMNQHGFAKDMNFALLHKDNTSLHYGITQTEETLKQYPFNFNLEIRYKLVENTLHVTWLVKNTGNETMYFQIGAHPGFLYRDFKTEDKVHGYLSFNHIDKVVSSNLTSKGFSAPGTYEFPLEAGFLPITDCLFDSDTIIMEEGKVSRVTLHDKNKQPYITVGFDMPVLAIWSPCTQNAPFVCLEPWHGLCDRDGYDGEFAGRDFSNSLACGATFENTYHISLD